MEKAPGFGESNLGNQPLQLKFNNYFGGGAEVAANFFGIFQQFLETGVFRILDMKLKEDMSENHR